MPPFIGWEMHCDMIEGQQMSKKWDDMAEREENVVELGAWLEWEMQQIKLDCCLISTFVIRVVSSEASEIKLIHLDVTAAH